MKSDAGRFQSQTKYDRQRDLRDYFWLVVNAYNQTRELSPLVASSCDPDARPIKLGVDGLHFCADVEIASRKALGNNPALFEQWVRLVKGENTPNSGSIIGRCARLYRARGLAPATYFRRVKKGRPGLQRVVAAQGAA